jgi:uncharacterized membrane protein required for colicin V production
MKSRDSAVPGLFHQLVKSILELLLYFFHFFFVFPVEPLLLQVQLVPLHDKLLKSVKDILLD